jgi:hypothetical protein
MELRRDLLKFIHATCDRDYIATLAGEGFGHLDSEAAGAARNKGDLAPEIKIILHAEKLVIKKSPQY